MLFTRSYSCSILRNGRRACSHRPPCNARDPLVGGHADAADRPAVSCFLLDRPAAQLRLLAADTCNAAATSDRRPRCNARGMMIGKHACRRRRTCNERDLLIGKSAAATDAPAAQLLLLATDRPRRHRPPRNARGLLIGKTAAAATDRPATQLLLDGRRACLIGTNAAATDRPATQLLLLATARPRRHRPPHNARAKTPPPQTAPERARRHSRPPRSATTSFYHRQPPPPQTAPQRNYCPTTRAAC